MKSGEVTQWPKWLKHLGQIQGLEFISLESMSKPCSHGAMYNRGTSRDWIQRMLPCYTSQNWGISRSGSVRGPALINNVENNFRCPETCTHVQLHTHGNAYTHICTPYSYTYRNIKWIKLLSSFFFFSGFTNESVAYAISLLWVFFYCF